MSIIGKVRGCTSSLIPTVEPLSVFLIRRSETAFDASWLLVKTLHHGTHEESSVKRLSLASLFAAVLINAVTAVGWGKATQRTSRTVASSKRLGALVAQLR